MELKFKPERLTIIKRLRGLTLSEIDQRMKDESGSKNSYNIDRWEKVLSKHPFDRVNLLAKATGVPVGFYYYNNIEIEMKDLKVYILIVDTQERVYFNFLQPNI